MDWNRYSYARYNPLKYTDPSGHTPVCVGAVINGVCQQWAGLTGTNAAAGFEKDKGFKNDIDANFSYISKQWGRKAAIEYVAKVKNINLAPGDSWDYANYISFGNEPTQGWTPSRPNDPYYDSNGNVQAANDESVFITGAGFDECGISVECLAGIMAHEATHSWVELKIEQSSTTGQQRTDTYILPEEMLADAVAVNMGDPTGVLNRHYYDKADQCRQQFGYDCSPMPMLESFYGINLKNISQLVYGK